jgi:hypothetical protein
MEPESHREYPNAHSFLLSLVPNPEEVSVLLTETFFLLSIEGSLMAQILPWHSIRQSDRNVYHDDDQCPLGKGIDEKYRRMGHRCRQRCRSCDKLRRGVLAVHF